MVVGLPEADLQLGDLALGLLQGTPGLEHVQLSRRAGLIARFGELQRLTLQFHVGPGVRDSLLEGAHLRVVSPHVAQQGDQHVIVILDRGVQAIVGRFNGTAEPAPEVELPDEGEPVSPLRVERRADVRAVGNCRADRVALVIACCLLRLREEVADGDGLPGARLQHPAAGLAQRQVLEVCVADKRTQHRVVEDRPPPAQVVVLIPDAHVGGVDPVFRCWRRRPAVVGPDLEPVVNVFLEVSTSGQRHHQHQQAGERTGAHTETPSRGTRVLPIRGCRAMTSPEYLHKSYDRHYRPFPFNDSGSSAPPTMPSHPSGTGVTFKVRPPRQIDSARRGGVDDSSVGRRVRRSLGYVERRSWP